MRISAFLLVLLTACQPPAGPVSAPLTQKEEQTAKDLIQGAFDDLWAGTDTSKVSQYHTDDFLLLEQGMVWNNDSVQQYMLSQLAQEDRPVRTNRMEYLSIDKYGNSIQIAYYNFADFTREDSLLGKARWLESALAVSTADGWRLKMMHSTWAGNPD